MWLEVMLTVTTSSGFINSQSVFLYPATSAIKVVTLPFNLIRYINFRSAPFAIQVDCIVNATNLIGVVADPTSIYSLLAWSDIPNLGPIASRQVYKSSIFFTQGQKKVW